MINGIYAATLSILTSDLALDIDKTIQHSERIMDEGCNGVVFFGSTGQSQLISISISIQTQPNSAPAASNSSNLQQPTAASSSR